MSRIRRTSAMLAIACTITASIALAQNPERRERLLKAADAVAGVVAQQVEQAAAAPFFGRVVVLQEASAEDADSPPVEVNKGGLVVVEVRDTQSHPTKFDDPRIQPANAFDLMGRVRGVAMKDGKPLMGGGYTWLLLKPVKPGDAMITVIFKPNGGGDVVKRVHAIRVTESAAADESAPAEK